MDKAGKAQKISKLAQAQKLFNKKENKKDL